MNLKHGYLMVVEYKKEFSRISKYTPELVLTETFRCRQFENDLKKSIKRYLMVVTSLQVLNFYQLVQATMKIEKSEMMSRQRKLERKLSKGSSSSGKRTRESQVELVYSFATIGRRQGPTTILDSGRGTSTEQGQRLECPHCHKYHFGTCRRITGGCFRCGSTYHLIMNCPRGSITSRNPQGCSRGGSNVPPPTRDRGRGRGSSGQHRRSIAS